MNETKIGWRKAQVCFIVVAVPVPFNRLRQASARRLAGASFAFLCRQISWHPEDSRYAVNPRRSHARISALPLPAGLLVAVGGAVAWLGMSSFSDLPVSRKLH